MKLQNKSNSLWMMSSEIAFSKNNNSWINDSLLFYSPMVSPKSDPRHDPVISRPEKKYQQYHRFIKNFLSNFLKIFPFSPHGHTTIIKIKLFLQLIRVTLLTSLRQWLIQLFYIVCTFKRSSENANRRVDSLTVHQTGHGSRDRSTSS